MRSTTTLVIVADDYLVREGARTVLDGHPRVEVIATAAHPSQVLPAMAKQLPDVVLLDIRMPPTFSTEGLDLAREIRQTYPGTGIVVLSRHADPEYALDLLRDGSVGVAYLLKERPG